MTFELIRKCYKGLSNNYVLAISVGDFSRFGNSIQYSTYLDIYRIYNIYRGSLQFLNLKCTLFCASRGDKVFFS